MLLKETTLKIFLPILLRVYSYPRFLWTGACSMDAIEKIKFMNGHSQLNVSPPSLVLSFLPFFIVHQFWSITLRSFGTPSCTLLIFHLVKHDICFHRFKDWVHIIYPAWNHDYILCPDEKRQNGLRSFREYEVFYENGPSCQSHMRYSLAFVNSGWRTRFKGQFMSQLPFWMLWSEFDDPMLKLSHGLKPLIWGIPHEILA